MKGRQASVGPEDLNGAEVISNPAALRAQLREVLESPPFHGSRRCQQFLRHIVEKAIDGRQEDLKERTLGVELFGRSPSYDTGEDAIVRVTASDVRRRLHLFYAGNKFSICIEVPSGAYAPEFHKTSEPVGSTTVLPEPLTVPAPAVVEVQPARGLFRRRKTYAAAAAGVLVLFLCVWLVKKQIWPSPADILPWSDLFRHGRTVQLVLADPDLSTIESLLGYQISLAEYANRQYVGQQPLQPDLQRALLGLRGADVPIVDVGIALDISSLARASAAHLSVQPARSLQLRDIKTDDDYIFLGSPRSNPWTTLFQDQMEFDFVCDEGLHGEVIRNKHPRNGELTIYAPTTEALGTGQAFAVVAFVGNPSQAGHVLLLAGTNAEGTEVAGKVATNPELLSRTLRKCGINPSGPPVRFELLLRVHTMAGSPNTFDVLTCHQMTPPAA
jgi:hypothetical protein